MRGAWRDARQGRFAQLARCRRIPLRRQREWGGYRLLAVNLLFEAVLGLRLKLLLDGLVCGKDLLAIFG